MERSDLAWTLLDTFMKLLPKEIKPLKLPASRSECKQDLIPQEEFFYYALIPTALSVAVLALLQRRRWKWLNVFGGRPGVPCPINFLECRDDRLAYVAAFGLSSWTAWDALTGQIPFKWSEENRFVKNFARISACLMSALICYPIFGSITSDHAIGYAIGSVYIWMYSVVYFLSNYPCDKDGQFRLAVSILQIIPALICMIYLCVYLPMRFWKRLTKWWTYKFKSELQHSILSEDVKESDSYRYVRNLLAANRFEGILERKRVLEIARSKRYRNIPGFRYSLSMLVAILVSIQFIWVGSLDMIKFYKSLINRLHVPLNESIAFADGLSDDDAAIKIQHNVGELHIWLDAFEVSCYVSVTVAFLSTLTGLLLSLRGYRWHLLNMYRGQRLPMVPSVVERASPTYIVAGAARYVGFQFGYAIWGFVYQSILLLMICCGLSALYLFCFRYNKLRAIADSTFNVLGPIAIYFFGLLFVQRILVWRFFLQRDERGRLVLAFDNRRLLLNFQYFAVFANSTMGLVSCFIRICKALFFGAWTLPRLDVSMMNRHFERFDKGYAAYASLLAIESYHTNPVLVAFTKLMLISQIDNLIVVKAQNFYSAEEPLREVVQQNGRLNRKSTRSKTVRNRWHLYVTLHRNPGLRLLRKESIRIDRLMHAEEVILDDTLIEAPRLRLLVLRRLSERNKEP